LIPKNIEIIIQKYLNNEIRIDEEEILSKWISNPENKALFEEHIRLDFDILKSTTLFDGEQAYNKVLNRKSKKINLYPWLKFAAVLTGIVIAISYFYDKSFNKESNIGISSIPHIETKNEPVTLELSNGQVKEIDVEKSGNLITENGQTVGKQDKGKLSYLASNEVKTELIYNTISVPYGNTFTLELADGTSVHLNAGSKLRFPISFSGSKERRVFLEGEAFFDVSKDINHPFIVNANELNIEVLGTSFNVTAYSDDLVENVVLLEGSVKLFLKNNENSSVNLAPGFKGTFDKSSETNEISIQAVNTSLYTSWIEGRLTFRNTPFKTIIKRIEKQYNITIVNKNKQLNEEIFNASFDKEPIEKVLSYFKESYNIQFSVENNIVHIN
jgi:hypothetical protein